MRNMLSFFGLILISLSSFARISTTSLPNDLLKIQITGQNAKTLQSVFGNRILSADQNKDIGVIKSIDCSVDSKCTIVAIGEIIPNKEAIEMAQFDFKNQELKTQLIKEKASLLQVPFNGFLSRDESLDSSTLDKVIFELLEKSKESGKQSYKLGGLTKVSTYLKLQTNHFLICYAETENDSKTKNHTCEIFGLTQ